MGPDGESPALVGPQVIFGFDTEGRCTLSVGPGLEALGYLPNELVGVDLLELYAPDAANVASLRRALAGESFVSETQFGDRLIWTYYQPLYDVDGVMTGAIGVTTDTTRQHEAEAELQLSRERAKTLADLSVALTREVLDLDSLLAVAVRAVTELVGDFGAIWLRDVDADTLSPRAVWSGNPQLETFIKGLAKQAAGHPGWLDLAAVESLDGADLLDWSVVEDLGTLGPDGLEAGRAVGLHSLLRLPMRSRGRALGLIEVVRGNGNGPFTATDVALAVDVTERVALALDNALLLQAERQAHEDLLKFRALADASPLLIAMSDPEGYPTYASPRVASMGVEWIAGDIWKTVAQNAGPEVMTDMMAALTTGQPWSGDIALPGVSGGLVVNADAFPLRHPVSDEHLGMAFIAQDVTPLRQAEAALRASNAELKRFQALVEASSDFIGIASLDGRMVYINPAGRALIHLDPEAEVAGTRTADYLPSDQVPQLLEVERAAVLAHGHWEGESTLRDQRGGPAIPVAVASFLIRDLDTAEPFALATVRRDITDRLATDTALRQLAEQRQSLLSRLVEAQETERAKIADDIHDDSVQSLAAVSLRLGLLRRQLAEQAPGLLPSLDPVEASIADATERLRSLLFDLEPPDLSVGLAGALRNAAADLFTQTATSWVVDSDHEPDVPDATRAIAYRIAREALINVRKHAEATQVCVTVSGDISRLVVTITDDGRGPGEPQASPGHRGLTSMRDRAAITGGGWEIGPGPEGGTRVSFWLPRAPTEGSAARPSIEV